MYTQLCFICVSLCGHVYTSNNLLHPELPVRHDLKFLNVSELPEFPTPTDFYDKYVKPSTPFVVRAAVNERNFPAMTKWTDEYLRKNYGHVLVPLDLYGKKSNVPFAKFLDLYKKVDLYLVYHVAKIGERMLEDIYMAPTLVCGGLQNLIETAKLWFNSGGPSFQSIVHTDAYENINCIADGKKGFILIDKAMKDTMEVAMSLHETISSGNFDILTVDFEIFPALRDLTMYRVELNIGDCLYLPYGWYHQVDSSEGRNMAVSTWFYHTKWFNYSDCENKDLTPQTEFLMKYGLANSNRNHLMASVLPMYDLETVQKTDLFPWINGTSNVKEKIFRFLDKNGNSFLSWDELFSTHADKVVEMFPESFQLTLEDEPLYEIKPNPPGHDEF